MTTINSVLGPLDTSKLGFTLSHEHIIEGSAGIQTVYPEFIDREETVKRAIAELRQAHSEGVETIVELSTFDLGRDVRSLATISKYSGVQIICATGSWLDIPRVFWTATPDMIASLYSREIIEGIEGTSIKAGIIKVANDTGGVSRVGETILRAAARAHKSTSVPISTHTFAPERTGERQIRIFEEEGVDLNRVCIGHSNDSWDLEYLVGLIKKGVWLGLDRYPSGLPSSPDWEQRTGILKKLIDAGFGNRIMLGHDWSITTTVANRQEMDRLRQSNPDGYLFITRRVLPRLKDMGVSQERIDELMVENPRIFFENHK